MPLFPISDIYLYARHIDIFFFLLFISIIVTLFFLALQSFAISHISVNVLNFFSLMLDTYCTHVVLGSESLPSSPPYSIRFRNCFLVVGFYSNQFICFISIFLRWVLVYHLFPSFSLFYCFPDILLRKFIYASVILLLCFGYVT